MAHALQQQEEEHPSYAAEASSDSDDLSGPDPDSPGEDSTLGASAAAPEALASALAAEAVDEHLGVAGACYDELCQGALVQMNPKELEAINKKAGTNFKMPKPIAMVIPSELHRGPNAFTRAQEGARNKLSATLFGQPATLVQPRPNTELDREAHSYDSYEKDGTEKTAEKTVAEHLADMEAEAGEKAAYAEKYADVKRKYRGTGLSQKDFEEIAKAALADGAKSLDDLKEERMQARQARTDEEQAYAAAKNKVRQEEKKRGFFDQLSESDITAIAREQLAGSNETYADLRAARVAEQAERGREAATYERTKAAVKSSFKGLGASDVSEIAKKMLKAGIEVEEGKSLTPKELTNMKSFKNERVQDIKDRKQAGEEYLAKIDQRKEEIKAYRKEKGQSAPEREVRALALEIAKRDLGGDDDE